MREPELDAKPSKRRRLGRWAWRCVLLLVVFVVGWYVIGRATSPLRRVRIVDVALTGTTSNRKNNLVLIEDQPLIIATYNIAHARGLSPSNWAGDRDARLSELATLIASWDADVVVLNEVDFDSNWSGRTNQARVLAQRAGYAFVVEQTNYDLSLPGFRLRFGNAVLSRFPIVEASAIQYPSLSTFEAVGIGQKCGLVCTLDLGNDQAVRIVAVHWDSRDSETRFGSADALIALSQDDGPPIIAAGDFNCVVNRRKNPPTAIDRLDDSSASQWIGPALVIDAGLSFPSTNPVKLIDYVLAQPPCRVVRLEAIESTLSDHRPVLAEVVLER